MARIVWTDEAERRLRDIYEFIAADNPAAALETVQGIYDRAQVSSEFPRSDTGSLPQRAKFGSFFTGTIASPTW